MAREDLYSRKTRTAAPSGSTSRRGKIDFSSALSDRTTAPARPGGSAGRLLDKSAHRARKTARRAAGNNSKLDLSSLFEQIDQTQQGEAKSGGVIGALADLPLVGAGFDTAGKVLSTQPVQTILDVVDAPRAAVVSGVQEGFEELGWVPDNEEDFWSQAKRHMGYGEIVEAATPDMPQALKIASGFAGDVGFDPLSYVGVGLAKTAAQGAVKGTLAAGRRELAVQLADRAAEAGVNADRLIAEAGVKGRAALTARNLEKAGIDQVTKEALGIPDFGVSIGVGQNRIGLGGRRLAEGVQEAKGAIVERTGRLRHADAIRQIRNPDDEVRLVQTLLGGKGTFKQRADAAKILAVSSFRRGQGGRLEDQMHRWIQQEQAFRGLAHRSDHEAIIAAVESGAKGSAEADAVAGFYDALLQAARQQGLDVPERANYVPHRLTPEAKAALEDPEMVARLGLKPDKFRLERFEQPRLLAPGDSFMGETLKEASIAEVNDIARSKGLDFDWFDTDLVNLMHRSVGEAGRAAERHAISEQLVRHGLAQRADEISEQVVELSGKQRERVRGLQRLQARASRLQQSAEGRAATNRSKVVALLQRELKRAKNRQTVQIGKLEDAIERSVVKTEQLGVARDAADQALKTADVALTEAKRAAGVARRVERRRAKAEVARLQKIVDERRVDLDRLGAEYRQASADTIAAQGLLEETINLRKQQMSEAFERSGRRIRFGGTVEGERIERVVAPERAAVEGAQATEAQAGQALAEGERLVGDLEQAQAAVPSGPVSSPATVSAQRTVDKVRSELDKMDQVARQTVLERAEGEELLRQLEAREAEIDKVLGEKVPRRDSPLSAKKAELVHLSDRAKLLREVLGDETRDSIDRSIATLEGRATAAEMDALNFADEAAMRGDIIEGLKDAKTRTVVRYKLAKGMQEIAPGIMADPSTAQAIRNLISVFEDPTAMNRAIREWDKVVNWTKTWMVSTPGFVLRNLYGGVFNNLMAGVNFDDYAQFMRDFRVYERNPIGYADELRRRGRDVERFDSALDAISSTGWGLSASEAGRQVFRGERRSLPVFGSDNRYSRAIRSQNERVEDLLRGSHAYSVLRRGGSTQAAIDSVARWHFNYRDISQFDRAVKRVIPFWVFTSRNLPLQLQVLASKPHLVNRYLGNMQRELQAGTQEEDVVPDYFGDLGAIRLPFEIPGLQEGQQYLMPDLPILRVNEDLQRIQDPTDFLSDVIPMLRVPLELRAQQQFFGDLPIEQGYEPAPGWAQLPGVQQLLEATGQAQETDEGLMVKGPAAYAVEQNLPFVSRAGRVNPAGAKGSEGLLSALLGVSVRANTESRQAGELLRRRREIENLINDLEQLGGR